MTEVEATKGQRREGSLRSKLQGHPINASEMRALQDVAAGMANKDIARKHGWKPTTVKSILSCLMAKLDARDRAHAVTIGYLRGLLPDSPYARPDAARAARLVRRFAASGDARNVREWAGITAAMLGDFCAVAPATVLTWEHGEVPAGDALIDYAWCLDHLDRFGRLPTWSEKSLG